WLHDSRNQFHANLLTKQRRSLGAIYGPLIHFCSGISQTAGKKFRAYAQTAMDMPCVNFSVISEPWRRWRS
ncbi:MAG: hypothetical protein AAF680_09330, partial [Pseudomonadota bacterium]